MKKLSQICSLLAVVLLVASLAIVRDGRLLGHDLAKSAQPADADTSVITQNADGALTINTASLADDVKGFGGPVPLTITVKDGRIADITAQPNAETPDFFARASALLDEWRGKTVEEAQRVQPDAVSGATFSSNAIIANMQRGLAYASAHEPQEPSAGTYPWTWKHLVGLIVVLMAAVGPLFIKNRRYHTVQLLLNAGVVGLWGGACLSYSGITGYAANGIDLFASAVAVVMLVTAFVYPLFGKKGYYCAHVCPFGSLQHLAGQCTRRKLQIPPSVAGHLDTLRRAIWALLMLFIWTGVWADWTNYEPFTAFAFGSASWVAILLAVVFLVLSFFVQRPYCRFVCPMGTLLRIAQATK